MSVFTYNAIMAALACGVVFALVVLFFSFIAMIVRWRNPGRRKHVIRLLLALFTTCSYYLRPAIWAFSISTLICIVLFMTLGTTTIPILTTLISVGAIAGLLFYDQFLALFDG